MEYGTNLNSQIWDPSNNVKNKKEYYDEIL